jgi:hypothetical protein
MNCKSNEAEFLGAKLPKRSTRCKATNLLFFSQPKYKSVHVSNVIVEKSRGHSMLRQDLNKKWKARELKFLKI